MKIIIPMAGRGKRFLELAAQVPDFSLPKPMIRIFDKPMVQWAVQSFQPFFNQQLNKKPLTWQDLIFICLGEHEKEFTISDFLKNVFSKNINIIFTEKVTRGPAETALLAREFINSDEDIIVSDCDHHFDSTPLWRAINESYADPDYLGILPLIKPDDTEPTWSYVVLNPKNEVIDIREKDADLARQGAYGVVGAYYFRYGKDFVNETTAMINDGDLVGDTKKSEFYMSRIYYRLIKKGGVIRSVFIEKGYLLGMPKFVERFIKNYRIGPE